MRRYRVSRMPGLRPIWAVPWATPVGRLSAPSETIDNGSAIDRPRPELPFRIGWTKGQKALESGLRLKASIASENRRLPIRSITHHRRRFSRWVRNRRAKGRSCWNVTSGSSCVLSGGCPFSRPGRSRRPRRANSREGDPRLLKQRFSTPHSDWRPLAPRDETAVAVWWSVEMQSRHLPQLRSHAIYDVRNGEAENAGLRRLVGSTPAKVIGAAEIPFAAKPDASPGRQLTMFHPSLGGPRGKRDAFVLRRSTERLVPARPTTRGP